MEIFVLVLFLKITFFEFSLALIKPENITLNYFVKETLAITTSHKVIDNIESLVDCAMMCGLIQDCCGVTQETLTKNCFLFYYQTSNNCRNKPDGDTAVQFRKPMDCSELPPENPSGIYRLYLPRRTAVLVYCEMTDCGGAWTVLQRRQDGSEDFYRYWTDYKRGFGDLENEFWLGNDIIHYITSQKQFKVRFDLEDFDGLTAFAEYDTIHVNDETMDYGLNVTGYSGTAGALSSGPPYHLIYYTTTVVPFSTRDVDNDRNPTSCSVAFKKSGWWFIDCTSANINGIYEPGVTDHRTIHWSSWRGFQCLKKARMMIKPT